MKAAKVYVNPIRHKNRLEYGYLTKEERDKKASELRAKRYLVNCYDHDGTYIVDAYLIRETD
jgi:hypothetical protein